MSLISFDANKPLGDQSLDTLLCLVALITGRQLPDDATVEDGERYFQGKFKGDCELCPAKDRCLVYRFYG